MFISMSIELARDVHPEYLIPVPCRTLPALCAGSSYTSSLPRRLQLNVSRHSLFLQPRAARLYHPLIYHLDSR